MMDFLERSLSQIDQEHRRRRWQTCDAPQGRWVTVNGQRLLNFCSNDYLGLANDERLKKAAKDAISRRGLGSGSARLVCGTMPEHVTLEKQISALKQTEACLLFSTGYMANIGVIPSLVGREDVVLADKWNHACLVDGALLSRATVKRYAHRDMTMLKSVLAKSGRYRRRLIVTDSVFSMDGDCAPLDDIVMLAEKYDAMVMVDEAHGFGVFGDRGAGLVEKMGLQGRVHVQMGTLSKAAGCLGGYVAGSQVLIDYLVNHARSFVYTTGMPPSVAAAACEAVRIIEKSSDSRRELQKKANFLKQGLQGEGFEPSDHVTPIVPVIVKDSAHALSWAAALKEQGFWVQAIRPPTVPEGTARLRITVTAQHTWHDVERLLDALIKLRSQQCHT